MKSSPASRGRALPRLLLPTQLLMLNMSFCNMYTAVYQTVHVTSLQSLLASDFICQESYLAFNQDEAFIPLCRDTEQIFMGISFLSPSLRARGLIRKAEAEDYRFLGPANWQLQ